MSLPPRILSRVGCILILSSAIAVADTIVLKSGEKFEGKLISNTSSSVDAEIQVTPSITDIRTFQRSDIQEILKTDPSVAAYAAIKGIKLGPNSMAASDYETIIYGKLKPFVDAYPDNEHAATVKQKLDALAAERDRVKAGELKLNHQWFTADQIAKDKYNVIAAVLLAQMQALAAQGDFIGALNQFATLEKNYPGSKVFPEAIEYARKLIPGVKKTIENRKLVYQRDIAARDEGIAITPDYKKPELLAAVKAEEEQVNEALDAAKLAGIVWTPIYPRSQRSLDDLSKTVESETTRLAQLKPGAMRASIRESIEGRELLESGDISDAESQFTAASTHWAANEMIKENTSLLAAAKATPAPGSATATTPPKPAATSVAQASTPTSPTVAPAAPAAPAAPTSPTVAPASAAATPIPVEAKSAALGTQVASVTPAASAAPKAALPALPFPPGSESSILVTLQIVAAIFATLAVGVIGGIVFMRIRSKSKVTKEESKHDHASV
ncbi:MAG TPA: PTPDL family protein [Chthoniobacterales bacterium]